LAGAADSSETRRARSLLKHPGTMPKARSRVSRAAGSHRQLRRQIVMTTKKETRMSQNCHLRSVRSLRAQLAHLVRDQRGASFIEYIIVVGLVAIIAITAFTKFGDKVVGKLGEETKALDQIKTSTGTP
jgi:Flp pilus assembly pilin Flp